MAKHEKERDRPNNPTAEHYVKQRTSSRGLNWIPVVLVIASAMLFFGWLVDQAPPLLGQPILSITAMVCIAFMFSMWMWRRSPGG